MENKPLPSPREPARPRKRIGPLSAAGIAFVGAMELAPTVHAQEYVTGAEARQLLRRLGLRPSGQRRERLPGPMEASGFERAGPGAPTNEEIVQIENSIVPPQYGILLRRVRVADEEQALPSRYGIAAVNSDGVYDVNEQEITVSPSLFSRIRGRGVDVGVFYNDLLLHENSHAFNWDNAPNLTPEQRRVYKETFIRHVQDGTPQISNLYTRSIRNPNHEREVEIRALEYQAVLSAAVLSLPVPEAGSEAWDEAIAQRLHEIYHLPLVNARFEVRLFRWMIGLVFPGRSPETMHREIQTSIRPALEHSNDQINATVFADTLPSDLMDLATSSFDLPENERWLQRYAYTRRIRTHRSRHSARGELLLQQRDRLEQVRRDAARESDRPALMVRFFNEATAIGQSCHQARLSRQASERFAHAYELLSPHDREVAERYFPTYGQLLQFKPSLYHVSPSLAQVAMPSPSL